MNIVLIANIISFIGCVLLVLIGFIKSKRNILLAQNGMFVILGIAYLLLGGIGAVISNIISFVRNTICLKWDLNWPLKIIFVVIQGALTVYTNDAGLIGYLPFISAGIYTLTIDIKDEVKLKSILILTQLCWVIYDFIFKNYSAFTFDILTCISTFIGIIMILRDRKNISEI